MLINLAPRKDKKLDFGAMDEFMDFILEAIRDHGSTAVRVFPPASHVLLLFSERLSSEVVSRAFVNFLSFSLTDRLLKGWGIYNHSSRLR